MRTHYKCPGIIAAGAHTKKLFPLAFALLMACVTVQVFAQTSIPRVVVVRSGTADVDIYRASFIAGMRDLGYTNGSNVSLDYRYYGDDYGKLKLLLADVMQSKVTVFVTTGTPATRAAREAAPNVPIVMSPVADPMGAGLIASFAKPGGQVTGLAILSAEMAIKRIDLLKDLRREAARIAFLVHPSNPAHVSMMASIGDVMAERKITARSFAARAPEDFRRAFQAMTTWRADGVVVLDDAAFNSVHRGLIAAEAVKNRLPAICGFRAMAEAGCLLSYAVSLEDTWRRAAVFVDKILKGANAGDLPVEQASQFQLIVNQKTAKTLGITVPQTVLFRADSLID
jgi:putative tryptophan/tyrosine transport system substrate-binding protein